jgi:hypothetical protein
VTSNYISRKQKHRNTMDNAQQQIVESIKSTSNILVTVSTNPSVDELSAALGLTLLLDKMDKRATSVVSGDIPPAIKFLDPDKTFENSADSLRDFIIALDKEKADHLRYKVEGDSVKIFITPYKTTLSQDDLEFSQGDYNVELVIGLGVKDQDHLDKALDTHGKILHDAKVMTITAGADASNLGSVDWHDNNASSLSEMIGALAEQLKGAEPLLDEQTSTALLTGIVSSTDRFSNNRTSSKVMTMAAQLMAAGANQQLIAAKLEEAHDIAPAQDSGSSPLATSDGSVKSDGTELVINRNEDDAKSDVAGEEKVIEPIPASEQAPEPAASDEDTVQSELEKQLAGLNKPAATDTLADIESELKQAAADQSADAAATEPLTAPKDTSMPGFEPTDVEKAAEPAPAEIIPQAESDSTPPPAIINNHGSINTTPQEGTPPINGIESDKEDATVDPFNVPAVSHQGATVSPTSEGGTPEGAAVLAESPMTTAIDLPASPLDMPADPIEETVPLADPVALPSMPAVPSVQTPEIDIPELPPLPPLPPLPTDASVPPLPPPPPPPPVFAAPGGVMPAGAVSGDVFGDGAAEPTTAPVAPPEPGQFKIPGS